MPVSDRFLYQSDILIGIFYFCAEKTKRVFRMAELLEKAYRHHGEKGKDKGIGGIVMILGRCKVAENKIVRHASVSYIVQSFIQRRGGGVSAHFAQKHRPAFVHALQSEIKLCRCCRRE